jgi:hypothetical protein
MPERSGFFTSSNGDRKYKPDRFAKRFRNFFTDGVIVDGGGVLSTELEVSAVGGNLQTSIAEGFANVQGYDFEVYDAPVILTHPTADGVNDRIDRVVIQMSRETNRISQLIVLEGTPAGSPVAPSLTRDATDYYELSLAQVLVQAGATALTGGDITDERPDSALCGISNANVGVTPPTGNSASVVTVDDTDFVLVKETDQQSFDASADQELKNARIADATTGVADAYVYATGGLVTTGNPFDRTIDGNILKVKIHATNTGASTMAEDGQTAKSIKKFDVAGDAFVDVEAEDLPKNGVIDLVWSVADDFFIYSPKGGAKVTIQNVYAAISATVTNLAITAVADIEKSYAIVTSEAGANIGPGRMRAKLTTTSNVQVNRLGAGAGVVKIQVIEDSSIKTMQRGTFVFLSGATSRAQTVSSYDPLKYVLMFSNDEVAFAPGATQMFLTGEITHATSLTYAVGSSPGSNKNIDYFLFER